MSAHMSPKRPFYFKMIRVGNQYNIVKMHPKFEKVTKIRKESGLRQRRLKSSILDADRLLAEKLANCSKIEPCDSAACPHCFRQFRKWVYAELVHLLRRYK